MNELVLLEAQARTAPILLTSRDKGTICVSPLFMPALVEFTDDGTQIIILPPGEHLDFMVIEPVDEVWKRFREGVLAYLKLIEDLSETK